MGTNHAETLARVAAVIFGISLGASPAQAEIGVNMIANPSFEEADGDLPAGWRITRAGQEDPPAVEYPDASAPGADGTLDPSTGDRYVRFVNAPVPGPLPLAPSI